MHYPAQYILGNWGYLESMGCAVMFGGIQHDGVENEGPWPSHFVDTIAA